MSAVTPEVRIAAEEAFARLHSDRRNTLAQCLRAALEAAAPLIVSHRETATAAAIAKAERERVRRVISSRAQDLNEADPYERGKAMAYAGLLMELSDDPKPVIINVPAEG